MEYNFKNLVFEGGGVKGVAYLGAMEVLEQKQILQKIERVGGTSAGAINALLFGLGYTNKEIKQIIMSLDFESFLDDSFGVIRDTIRLIKDFGWHKGDNFRNWIADIIEYKTGNPNATFADLKRNKDKGFRDLYFIGVNLSTGFATTFSYEDTPNFPIADAIRISMAIPLFFTAIKNNGDVFVDGGLLNNYPIKLFDKEKYTSNKKAVRKTEYYENYNQENIQKDLLVYNKETLGFKLDNKTEIAIFKNTKKPDSKKIKNIFDYIKNLINTVLEFQSNQHIHGDDWQRTIYIDTLGVKTTDFDISNNKKVKLAESGKKHTERYFEWFDNKANVPINKFEKEKELIDS